MGGYGMIYQVFRTTPGERGAPGAAGVRVSGPGTRIRVRVRVDSTIYAYAHARGRNARTEYAQGRGRSPRRYAPRTATEAVRTRA